VGAMFIFRRATIAVLGAALVLLPKAHLLAEQRSPSIVPRAVQPNNNCTEPGPVKDGMYALPLTIAIGITWHMPWLKIEKQTAKHVTSISPALPGPGTAKGWQAGTPVFKPATYQINGTTNLGFPNDPQKDRGAKVQIVGCQRGVQFNIWMIDYANNAVGNPLSFALVFERSMAEKDVLEEGEIFLIR
jgi:hypothetical protein